MHWTSVYLIGLLRRKKRRKGRRRRKHWRRRKGRRSPLSALPSRHLYALFLLFRVEGGGGPTTTQLLPKKTRPFSLSPLSHVSSSPTLATTILGHRIPTPLTRTLAGIRFPIFLPRPPFSSSSPLIIHRNGHSPLRADPRFLALDAVITV